MGRLVASLVFAGLMCCSVQSLADDAPGQPAMTKHQMMKECMAKQKASESGMPKDKMRKACKDVTKTEKQNADRAPSSPTNGSPD